MPSFAVGRSRKHVTALITVVSKNLTSTTKSFASTPQTFDSSTRRLKKTGLEELVRVAINWSCTYLALPKFVRTDVFVWGALKLPSNIGVRKHTFNKLCEVVISSKKQSVLSDKIHK